MAFDYAQTLDRISSKADMVLQKYRMLEQAKADVDAQVLVLQEKIDQMEKELRQLRTDNEYLRLAATIAPSREQVESARAMVTSLVREIDRCIVDLSD